MMRARTVISRSLGFFAGINGVCDRIVIGARLCVLNTLLPADLATAHPRYQGGAPARCLKSATLAISAVNIAHS